MLKIRSECRCDFNKNDLLNSNIECKGSDELTYTATLEYSSDNGSETASIIAERIVRQLPFSMSVGGFQLTVTSACADCEDTAKGQLSSAAGGGLFVGGFTAAILIALTLVIIVYVSQYLHSFSQIADPGGMKYVFFHSFFQCAQYTTYNRVIISFSPFSAYNIVQRSQERGPGDEAKETAVCYSFLYPNPLPIHALA